MLIRVDCTSLTAVVVGLPRPQVRDGVAVADRASGRPVVDIDMTLITDGRPESIQVSLPDNGFPPDLAVGTVVTFEALVCITWEKNGRHGLMWRAQAVRPLVAPSSNSKAAVS